MTNLAGTHGLAVLLWIATVSAAFAQTSGVTGAVRDKTDGRLPGVSVELRRGSTLVGTVQTDAAGVYRFDAVPPGRYQIVFSLINFAVARRDVTVTPPRPTHLDIVLHLALSADVIVTGKRTFANLADAERPAEDLVGIAQSASQGAITARQLDTRPLMRAGDVLEAVPGVIMSQHSGEGKANQYYLRGFNLDHGTDFATTLAGMPVNLPTHAHGHGYADLNFLIPELVSGVQFSKGPYFADQGDFATAGAANINYANTLDRLIARVGSGNEGFSRALVAVSPKVNGGRLLAAVEVEHNDGPWSVADDYRKVNGLVRFSRGDAIDGFSITAMAYRAKWNATDQIPLRAVSDGRVGRFGTLNPTDGGDSYRYSGSFDWQGARANATTKLTAYGIAYDVNLFSDFTFFLDDPVHGDQFQQADHRFTSGAKLSHRRLGRWAGRSMQNSFGVQVRNDHITNLGLYHTQARRHVDTIREDAVVQTSGALYAQNELEWKPWLRTLVGMRVDGYRFRVDAGDAVNSGSAQAGLVSPKAGVAMGPWRGTELYVNAGYGFHSNDARGATITRDPSTLAQVDRVTPLARAKGAEIGLRTVALPHLQSTVALWTLGLASELVFVGDAGTTDVGRPSRRSGIEWTNYFTPRPWLVLDADIAWSRARFTDGDVAGAHIPGSVETVLSAGVTVDHLRNYFGSVRVRYFGPRPLVEDDAVRSKATTLVNLEAGYRLSKRVKIALDVFNLLNVQHSDIDYYYASRLPGEPLGGVSDLHFHPTLPRTARIGLLLGF